MDRWIERCQDGYARAGQEDSGDGKENNLSVPETFQDIFNISIGVIGMIETGHY